MAELTPKPFSALSGFLYRIFKGAPAYYAQPDLQQYFDSLEYALKRTEKLILGDVTGSIVLHPDSSWNASKNVFTLRLSLVGALNISIGKQRITLPDTALDYLDTMPFLGTTVGQNDPVLGTPVMLSNITNVVLLASRRVITFTQDTEKGGITGPTVPVPLESSDVVEYYDFSLGIVKGTDVPEFVAGKEVICVMAQFTFYFDSYWKPVLIQNFRQNKTDMAAVSSGKFPVVNSVLSAFGQFDWFNKVMEALNSLALRIDGSNDAITDLYVNKGANGRFKFITAQDYATTLTAGISKLATEVEVMNPQNNSSVVTPFGLYKAMGATRKIYELGVWDMDSTDSVTIPHNLGASWLTAIPSICGIFSDDHSIAQNLYSDAGCKISLNATHIYIERGVAGIFDSLEFNDTALLNRGYVILDLINTAEEAPLTAPVVSAGADSALVIVLGSSSIAQVFTGSITSVVSGANIISRGWGIVSGPGNVGTSYASNAPDSMQYTFNSPGTYVLRYSVTITDGTDTVTGTDNTTVVVTAETVSVPTALLKWDDFTTGTKVYSGSSPYSITLNGTVANLGSTTKIAQEFSWRSRPTVNDVWGAWETTPFSTQGSGDDRHTAAFNVDQDYNFVEFRVRFQNSLNVWSDYSNVLAAKVDYTSLASGFNLRYPGTPVVVPTGALGTTPEMLYTGKISFAVSGVLVNPTFDFRAVSLKEYLEYDPNNVQALPNPVTNYDWSTKIMLEGYFDCNTLEGFNDLKLAIILAFNNYIFDNGNTTYVGFLPYITTEEGVWLADPKGGYFFDISITISRGSPAVNQVLSQSNPPTLATRVSVKLYLTHFLADTTGLVVAP